jgi:tryptophan synthase beta chain
VLHPGTLQPVGPADLEPLFPMALIAQEVATERMIEIPEPVREIYRLWRPSPLYRAHRLERALDTPARIYYKYEGVSPAGSHKPNTAVAQAFYNQQAGVKRLTTETGAGQWGSALAFAGALFGLEVRVYMVRVSFDQKPYRKAMMEAWGAQCVASPSEETNAGRQNLAEHPNSPGSLGIAISEAVEVASQRADTKYALGSVLNHVLLAPDRHRPGGDGAARDGRRLSRHHRRLHRRRQQFRRHCLPVYRRGPAWRRQAARHRLRALGLPEPNARQIRL